MWKSKLVITLHIRNPHDGKLRSFAQLKAAYDIEDKDFVKYVQIRSQLSKYFGEAVVIPRTTDNETKLKKPNLTKSQTCIKTI